MPPPLISKEEVVARIAGAFKQRGYDGASLANLSDTTGLVKASLYHYFPEGKKAMAEAALDAFGESMERDVIVPLLSDNPPRQRLLSMIDGMDRVYAGGADLCLFALLSVGESRALFHEAIIRKINQLAEALSRTYQEIGLSAAQSQMRTEATIVQIEGALIVARVLDDPGVFDRTLRRLRHEIEAEAA